MSQATEYEAWVVAARPFLEKAVSNETNSGRWDGSSVTLFLDERAADHEALNVGGLKVWRVLVRFEKKES